MRDSTNLPDLRMLPTVRLVNHEDSDPRRVARLAQRIKAEGILKNPPVVADLPGSDCFVVLDGANRTSAFQYLNIPHIVVQLVNYDDPGVLVDTWYHVVSGMRLTDFEQSLTQVDDLRLQTAQLDEARMELAQGDILAYIVCQAGVRKVLGKPDKRSGDHSRLLADIVSTYKGKADIFRASNDIWEKQEPYYPDITALVIFPRYHPEDIFSAALNGYKIPSGITRHVIQARALNINIPLSVLSADDDLEKKERWLHKWLMERMAANAIRYYAESTFSYNE